MKTENLARAIIYRHVSNVDGATLRPTFEPFDISWKEVDRKNFSKENMPKKGKHSK